jgi:dimethylargininase
MFKNAIVRRLGSSLVNGITSAPELGKPEYRLAIKQHDAYIDALKSYGVEVTVLEADERFPDSCFVEDVAVCTKIFAVITNSGASSRKGEGKEIIEVIKKYYNDIEYIKEPGILESGDIMMVKGHFYIGPSKRTNREGGRTINKSFGKIWNVRFDCRNFRDASFKKWVSVFRG